MAERESDVHKEIDSVAQYLRDVANSGPRGDELVRSTIDQIFADVSGSMSPEEHERVDARRNQMNMRNA